jgi:predicted ATPase/DNA-binding SARP family transcriptional activator
VWVELAGLEDAALIAPRVGRVGRLGEELRDDAALVAAIGERPLVLVLDNCEHVIEGVAALVEAVLRGCPRVRVLCTSREPLRIRGERAWLVPPLSLPGALLGSPQELETSEAVRLFVERAQEVAPEFRLTGANGAAVAEICHRLDGIPLAIELAAARVTVLPPEQLRTRLDDAFRVLGTGRRGTVPRHRTLRAAIDWSYDLLDPAAATLLRRLAVFRGGFTLDAIEAVCTCNEIDGAAILDLMASLVDRSLVTVRELHGVARYALLETVRQYAAQRLEESGAVTPLRDRHARYFDDLVTSLEPDFITPARRRAFDTLLPEIENIREALHWTRQHDGERHVRLVGRLWWFWYSSKHWLEAGRWLEEALALPEADEPAARAPLLFALGALTALQGQPDRAQPLLEECMRHAAAVGDDRLEAYAWNYLGVTLGQLGRVEAAEYSARAAEWFRAHDDLYGLRLALLIIGNASLFAGRLDDALAQMHEALAIAQRFGQERELTITYQMIASVHIRRGEDELAEARLLDALTASREDPAYLFVARVFGDLAELAARRGDLARAGRLFGGADALRASIGARPFKTDADRQALLFESVRAGPHAALFDAALAEGRTLTMEEVRDEVLRGVAPPPVHVAEPVPAAVAAGVPAAAAGPALRVRVLGGFEVWRHGERIGDDAWTYAKPRELLAYLALNPEGRTRQQIGAALWPDAAPAQVKNSFHVTMHHLRKALGDATWVIREEERYRLAPELGCELDARRFEDAARAALGNGRSAAAALYTGDFLEGQPEARWLLEERDRLRALYVDVALHAGAELEAAGDHRAAAEHYHALALREDINEEVHRRLMLCWARAGERARALRHYERVVELLAHTLDAEPESETSAVAERIRSSSI